MSLERLRATLSRRCRHCRSTCRRCRAELRALHYRPGKPRPFRARRFRPARRLSISMPKPNWRSTPISNGKATTLVVFTYPAMEMARNRIAHFQQIPGAVVKRTGPLVAVALQSGQRRTKRNGCCRGSNIRRKSRSPNMPPTLKDNPANLFLNIFILCLVLAGILRSVSGLVVGGLPDSVAPRRARRARATT